MMKYKGPGCYRFIDEYGKVIYVGSAKNIDRRIHSHFSKGGHLPKECYQKVERHDVCLCRSGENTYIRACEQNLYFL